MRLPRFPLSLAFATFGIVACSTPAGTDAADVPTVVDSGTVDTGVDAPRDVSTDGPSPAGNSCMVDSECGPGFQCLLGFVEGGLCTHACTETASPSTEARACGGAGATCLAQGDGTGASAYCEHACDPTATMTGCRTGFVCTGWWFTHADAAPDAPGCWTFCSADSDCPSGSHCDVRAGSCGTDTLVPARKPDGEPCTPVTMGRTTECRGLCFTVDMTDPTHGICGSLINTAVTTACPDDPAHIVQGGGTTDDIGLCLYRSCTTDCDCTAPLVCTPVTGSTTTDHVCDYPSSSAPGIPMAGPMARSMRLPMQRATRPSQTRRLATEHVHFGRVVRFEARRRVRAVSLTGCVDRELGNAVDILGRDDLSAVQ